MTNCGRWVARRAGHFAPSCTDHHYCRSRWTGSRRRPVVVGTAAACAILTWTGFVLEPAGAAWWTSAFDRLMVTLVLAATALLVLRRMALVSALAERTAALEAAAEDLSRSNAELDRFASRVAHDLRAPLNGIGLVTQLLASGGRGDGGDGGGDGGDPESRELAETVKAQIEKMGQLIQRLLTYGRVGGGAVRLSDCDSVLRTVLRCLTASVADHGATVTHDPLPTLRADPVLVSELFQNLVENAIKYRGPRAPEVHVSSTPGDAGAIFCVRDNGVGIGEEDRERIFRPFTQLGAAGDARGVGLGLATCRRIVERHGGRIWVGPAPGGGTAFHFTLTPATIAAEVS